MNFINAMAMSAGDRVEVRAGDTLLGALARPPSKSIAGKVIAAIRPEQILLEQPAGSGAPAVVDLVASAAAARWGSSRDLPEALEKLGVIAVVKGADRAGDGDRLEDELFSFGRSVMVPPKSANNNPLYRTKNQLPLAERPVQFCKDL